MVGPEFNVEGLEFWVGRPHKVSMERWEEIQFLARTALTDAEPQHADDMAWAVHDGDLDRFVAGRLDPQVDVTDGRLREDQDFDELGVVMAIDESKHVVGYAYSADNTSGKPAFIRHAKMRLSPDSNLPKLSHRRYAWIRETFVDPEYQDRGIAHALAYLSLDERHPKQPVTVYEWDPSSRAVASLARLGFEQTGSQMKARFGKGSNEGELVRFAAYRAQTVKDNIIGLNQSAAQAIREIRRERPKY